MEPTALDKVSMVLVIIGGLNWGLVGAFEYSLVDSLFGVGSGLSRTVYVIVGLAAVWAVYGMVKMAGKATSSK